ncbi:unnamed protein product [Sphagnum jensenii]|uniref:Uncharacterized protein n=1 Tax=Sphagnum jensenii TaxID=128206 RepID=A0ABP1AQL8_9BRYO
MVSIRLSVCLSVQVSILVSEPRQTDRTSGLQLQRSLSKETAKVHKLQEKVVKHEKAFQVKSSELTWHRPNSCNFSLHLRWKGKNKTQQSRANGCCSKSYERPVLIHIHSWKLAAGWRKSKRVSRNW